MVNSNVPRYSCSGLHRHLLFKFKFCLQFDQTGTWWLRCANGLETPAATKLKSYSFNPLWTMITTMFQEKSNTYRISEPIIRRFFPATCARLQITLRSSCIDSFSFAKRTLQHFARFRRLFRSVMWSILVPFSFLLSFFLFFFSFLI